jgi:hypothetical protein
MQLPWVGQTEYSELEMTLRAALFALPVLGVILAWDLSKWPRAIVLWFLASLMTYLYGRWVREDEDE